MWPWSLASCDIELWPPDRKVDHFMPLSRGHLFQKASKFVHSFQNMVFTILVTDNERIDGQVKSIRFRLSVSLAWRRDTNGGVTYRKLLILPSNCRAIASVCWKNKWRSGQPCYSLKHIECLLWPMCNVSKDDRSPSRKVSIGLGLVSSRTVNQKYQLRTSRSRLHPCQKCQLPVKENRFL